MENRGDESGMTTRLEAAGSASTDSAGERFWRKVIMRVGVVSVLAILGGVVLSLLFSVGILTVTFTWRHALVCAMLVFGGFTLLGIILASALWFERPTKG